MALSKGPKGSKTVNDVSTLKALAANCCATVLLGLIKSHKAVRRPGPAARQRLG